MERSPTCLDYWHYGVYDYSTVYHTREFNDLWWFKAGDFFGVLLYINLLTRIKLSYDMVMLFILTYPPPPSLLNPMYPPFSVIFGQVKPVFTPSTYIVATPPEVICIENAFQTFCPQV